MKLAELFEDNTLSDVITARDLISAAKRDKSAAKDYQAFITQLRDKNGVEYSTDVHHQASTLSTESVVMEKMNEFGKLQKNKVALTPEERKIVMDKKAIWHHNGGSPSPAVWKSVDENGKTTYVTNTHRAYQARPTLKGAISVYHSFIKDTA